MSLDLPVALTGLEFQLVNSFQRDFPLLTNPFAVLAQRLETDESTIINYLQKLQDAGVVSRVGAVFRPNVIGASALAAIAVPTSQFGSVADYISALPEINHNYEREHHFNLWFVATAPSADRLQQVFQEIEQACACGPVLVLPLRDDYHIDLGFDLSDGASRKFTRTPAKNVAASSLSLQTLAPSTQVLIAALQEGLPLVTRPFAQLGLPEPEAIAMIAGWLEQQVIRRFGIIVRHHEFGYTANAMAVWDVPDQVVTEIGRRIAASGNVTLCYRRARQLPDWSYNFFCMIHGKDRDDVKARLDALAVEYALSAYPHDVLFSLRRFKQRGAYYCGTMPEIAHG